MLLESGESLIGAARFSVNPSDSTVVVSILATDGNESVWRYLSNALLSRVEWMAHSLHKHHIQFDISNWRTDFLDLLESRGYVEVGGTLMARAINSDLAKDTMIMRWKKTLADSAQTDAKVDEDDILDSLNIQSVDISGLQVADSDHEAGSMHTHIFDNLFAALHREYPVGHPTHSTSANEKDTTD